MQHISKQSVHAHLLDASADQEHAPQILNMSPGERRRFAMSWVENAEWRMSAALREMARHTAIEVSEEYEQFKVQFEQANQEWLAAIELLNKEDQDEVLIRRPMREKDAGHLEIRLAKYCCWHKHLLSYDVTEWTEHDERGTVELHLEAAVLEEEGLAESLVDRVLCVMVNNEHGQCYEYHATYKSDLHIVVKLTHIIAPPIHGGQAL